MAHGKRSDARRIRSLELQKQALELRKSGATYRQIADALGISLGTVGKYIGKALRATETEIKQSLESLRALEVEILDAMYLAIAPAIQQGHLGAIDRGLRIRERRAKLLGLDQPTRVEVSDWRSQLVDDIRAGRVDYRVLAEAFDRSLADELFAQAGVPVAVEGKRADDDANRA